MSGWGAVMLFGALLLGGVLPAIADVNHEAERSRQLDECRRLGASPLAKTPGAVDECDWLLVAELQGVPPRPSFGYFTRSAWRHGGEAMAILAAPLALAAIVWAALAVAVPLLSLGGSE